MDTPGGSSPVSPRVGRFLEQIVEAEEVWGLEGRDGFAVCESNGPAGRPVLIFWSGREDARKCRRAFGEDYQPAWISLFEFLFRWLPEMASEGLLAGPEWTSGLAGPEVEPLDLMAQLEALMPSEMQSAYAMRLDEEMLFEAEEWG